MQVVEKRNAKDDVGADKQGVGQWQSWESGIVIVVIFHASFWKNNNNRFLAIREN
jgi:hypothetical protein